MLVVMVHVPGLVQCTPETVGVAAGIAAGAIFLVYNAYECVIVLAV